MKYPRVLTERDTLAAAHAGFSLARYGDGELALACGGSSVSQRYDERLSVELQTILRGDMARVLPCIPNLQSKTPRARYWANYAQPHYTRLYRSDALYGSSFITRPDNAPWIDTPSYWAEVRRLWLGKSVAYVSGNDRLLKIVREDTATVTVFHAPARDAYADIDTLTNRLLSRPYGAIIIALGAAGTALAARLGINGAQHALDLGHIGQFMENEGAYSIDPDTLATPAYRALLEHAHATTNWGRGGASWADKVHAFAVKVQAEQALDYGAGGRTLAPALKALGLKCFEYDPGVPEISAPPKLADLVVSTDVYEHIEPELVPNVLRHGYMLARKAGFFVIAKQPAKKILADGRNAHLTCQPTEWWVARLQEAGWAKVKVVQDEWKKCVLHCWK